MLFVENGGIPFPANLYFVPGEVISGISIEIVLGEFVTKSLVAINTMPMRDAIKAIIK